MVHRGRLDADSVRAVMALVQDVSEADGVVPLSEHALLHLRYGGDESVRHLLVEGDGEVVGYAHLDVTDEVEGSSAEVAVASAHRGRGVGRALVAAAIAESPDGRLRLWAHGRTSAAVALARSMGFERERVLLQLRRSLHAPLPAPELPGGVSVRTFEPGRDEQVWIEVNARAFADHPDQGRWTLDDVLRREQEPWFDPAGFFLAESDGRLVGFHWTKVHGATQHGHGHEPIGEVYVVGVDPSMQGRRLGPALTLVGLRHLRSRGLAQAMLYVDESNTNAIKVYESLGFTRWDVDASYCRA